MDAQITKFYYPWCSTACMRDLPKTSFFVYQVYKQNKPKYTNQKKPTTKKEKNNKKSVPSSEIVPCWQLTSAKTESLKTDLSKRAP